MVKPQIKNKKKLLCVQLEISQIWLIILLNGDFNYLMKPLWAEFKMQLVSLKIQTSFYNNLNKQEIIQPFVY